MLKKLTAISFLLLLVFNLLGYQFLFYYAQQQSDKQLEASLDKALYNEADLITIKVPLSIPYQIDRNDFERVDGEINLNGKIYKYVKRKVTEGQLVLLCLPDRHKMQLETAKGDFFKNVSDVAPNNGSKKSEKSKACSFTNILSEYEPQHSGYATITFSLNNTYHKSRYLLQLTAAPHTSPEQPPEIV